MTFADDFAPMEGSELEEQSPYPNVMGVVMTPTIGGALLGVLGLAGAIALGWYVVKPNWDTLNSLNFDVDAAETRKQELELKREQISQLQSQLQQTQNNQREVLGLFSGQDTMDTLLFVINQQIRTRGQFVRYTPPSTGLEAIPPEDLRYEETVKGLLKRQTLSLQIEATFQATQDILRSLERLQSVLVIHNLRTEVTTQESRIIDAQGNIGIQGQPILTSTFDVDLLVPLTEEELLETMGGQQGAEGEAPVE
ncbi:hypothetical protein K4A83_01040 [Spirulina subsalsa FACHB-351]|uniref:Type IV pilus assembly protein PilO n=1 Tax=Spirulina subsalsa FACHB-351 TaxID=234711 RepID=A0ABT3L050_9CYAN|nr:hypothetical protein [Spirulina subsalsa]MCW6034862.1 hypothetical protein [Spirulina subsalsa FACHB-351]